MSLFNRCTPDEDTAQKNREEKEENKNRRTEQKNKRTEEQNRTEENRRTCQLVSIRLGANPPCQNGMQHRVVVNRDLPRRPATEMTTVYKPNRRKWFTKVVHESGLRKWFTKVVHESGSRKWFTRVGWCLKQVGQQVHQRYRRAKKNSFYLNQWHRTQTMRLPNWTG